MAAKSSFEERVAEGAFERAFIQENIRKAQLEKEAVIAKVYRLQQSIVTRDQHILRLKAELDQSRQFYVIEIEKVKLEENVELGLSAVFV